MNLLQFYTNKKAQNLAGEFLGRLVLGLEDNNIKFLELLFSNYKILHEAINSGLIKLSLTL